jgi:hypothetical protein
MLAVLRRADFLRDVDLAEIMTNSTEKLLNLPGGLPFFPTKVKQIDEVRSFIRKLHPVTGGRRLIRMGPEGDGGYLVPDDLDGIEACFSPGVSNVAGFELDCANRGMKVFMADASVPKPPLSHPQFEFIKKFIGARTEGEFVTLEDWVHASLGDSNEDLLLQMDIEGYEYETILSTPVSVMNRFRIIVVEFHGIEGLCSEPLFSLYRLAFERILQTHACVHIHPNNYCQTITVQDLDLLQMAEFTFLRRDRVIDGSYSSIYPHPLDRDNTERQVVVLPKSFYRSE